MLVCVLPSLFANVDPYHKSCITVTSILCSASARDLCRRSQLQLLQDAAAIVGQVKAHGHGSRGSSRSHSLNYYFTNGAAVPHPFSKAYAHQWSMAHFGAPPSAVAGTFREAMLSSHSMLVIGIFVVM